MIVFTCTNLLNTLFSILSNSVTESPHLSSVAPPHFSLCQECYFQHLHFAFNHLLFSMLNVLFSTTRNLQVSAPYKTVGKITLHTNSFFLHWYLDTGIINTISRISMPDIPCSLNDPLPPLSLHLQRFTTLFFETSRFIRSLHLIPRPSLLHSHS